MQVLRKILKGLGRQMAALARDAAGLSAVEFALLLPVILTLYVGGAEISQAVSTYRLVDLTANTVTNLVAQYTTISTSAQMPDILKASVEVMYPRPANDVQVVVSLISIDANGRATVTWSQALNGAARPVGQVVTVPAALNVANTNVILGETTYAYSPAIDFMNFGSFSLYSSILMLPRASTTINLTA